MIRLRTSQPFFQKARGVHLAADGAEGSTDDSEGYGAPTTLVKKTGERGLALEMDKHYEKIVRKLL